MSKTSADPRYETFIDAELSCPECTGTLRPLGTLGTLDHYRCEDCGLNHSSEHNDTPAELDLTYA